MPAERPTVLGLPVDVVDMPEAVDRMAALVEARRRGERTRPALVVTLNPEMVMRARRELDLFAIVAAADLVVPDGIGLVRALRRRGYGSACRVSGIDLVLAYLPVAQARGHRIALCGGAPGVAHAAGRELRRLAPGLEIVATDSGDPGPDLAARLAKAGAEVVLAAYGAGPQERFLARYLGDIGAAVGMGVGGTLDVLSGRIPRAPETWRRLGLEWLWRLVRQPWRLRRQRVLPVFWWLERREAAARRRSQRANAA